MRIETLEKGLKLRDEINYLKELRDKAQAAKLCNTLDGKINSILE